MASQTDRSEETAAGRALVERQELEWEDSCAIVWREWMAAVVAAHLTLPPTRVSWH
jgi:hypothetical protein